MASKCEESLAKVRKPDRKTLGPGSLLRLKSQLKQLKVLSNGYTGTEPATHILAYWPDVPLHAKQTYELTPNQELRTLSSVFKEGGAPYRVKVEILPGGVQAVMYWVDIFNNAVVEKLEVIEQKPPITRHKFPNPWDRHRQNELWAQGQTAWGRPKAEIGQIVWIANHSRTMGRGSVGVLDAVDEISSHATVKTLDGGKKIAYQSDCVPLTEEEIGWFK